MIFPWFFFIFSAFYMPLSCSTYEAKVLQSVCIYPTPPPWERCIHMVNLLSRVKLIYGGARGVMVIIVGYGHIDTSSNPG